MEIIAKGWKTAGISDAVKKGSSSLESLLDDEILY